MTTSTENRGIMLAMFAKESCIADVCKGILLADVCKGIMLADVCKGIMLSDVCKGIMLATRKNPRSIFALCLVSY